MDKEKPKKKDRPPVHHVTISYDKLGTVHPRQQAQALIEDINTLMDQCGEFYLTGAKLVLPVTNEWGDPVILRKQTGQRVRQFDTNHYDPACRDYEL